MTRPVPDALPSDSPHMHMLPISTISVSHRSASHALRACSRALLASSKSGLAIDSGRRPRRGRVIWLLTAKVLVGEDVTMTYPEGHCINLALGTDVAAPEGEFGVTTPWMAVHPAAPSVA